MPTQYERRILRVLQYIDDNPAADLSLDALADIAAMSRFHWHRVFQAMTGETCAQTVRRIRMLKAARWLAFENGAIAQVAERVGYPNVQSFTRVFGEYYKVPPAEFRQGDWEHQIPTPAAKGKFKMFPVEIKQVPSLRLAALLHQGAYTLVGPCFQKLFQSAATTNLLPHVQGVASVYYDDPHSVPDADLRCHAGLVVPQNTKLPGDLEDVLMAGGTYAILHYKGAYPALVAAYDFLYGSWLPGSGREPRHAPCYERYLNSPADTPASDLLTDIYLPLAD